MDRVDPSTSSLLSLLQPGMKPGNTRQSRGADTKKAREKGDLRSIGKTIFSGLLEKSAPEAGELGPLRELVPSDEALTELMDAVHSAGSDLINRPFPDEILQYKKAVRNFVHYVVENGFTVEKIQTKRRELRSLGPHVQVKVVDRKLEELAAAILSGQTTQLERVSKIDEITGLLVDLTISGVIKVRDD